MNLNHLDLPVADTHATGEFFKHYLGFKVAFSRDDGLIVLLDEDGFALTLSPLAQGETTNYPSGFHLGFNVDSEDDLFEAHRAPRVRHQTAVFGLERSGASIESSTYGVDSQSSVVAHGSA